MCGSTYVINMSLNLTEILFGLIHSGTFSQHPEASPTFDVLIGGVKVYLIILSDRRCNYFKVSREYHQPSLSSPFAVHHKTKRRATKLVKKIDIDTAQRPTKFIS